MLVRAIAIDDEPIGLRLLENYCGRVEFLKLEKTFLKPSEALKYLKEYPVELIFLDVEMPTMSGLEFYKSVKRTVPVIFTTAHMQYAVEGFNLNALDFLLKPYSYERFLQAVDKARGQYAIEKETRSNEDNFLMVRVDYSLVKIRYAEIRYIESLKDYLKIHLDTGKFLLARLTMKAVCEMLPKDFIRVHRSFIVPYSRIRSVRNKTIDLGYVQVPIGESYEKDFLRLLGQ
ncbi:MAG: response regulator transcription factor [Sphingobacteriales bacterium]|nr:MAG: response regulator transcription factor [Sphingobacteriales bacterium]